MQNCIDVSDVYIWIETFPQCDRAYILTHDRPLRYISNATGLRSIQRLDREVMSVLLKSGQSVSREREMSRK